jgi:hypothetical protein
MNDDYEAESDLSVLIRAKEIEKDPARVQRAKRFADMRKHQFEQMSEELPGKPPKRFNGAAHHSKMGGHNA